MVRIQQGAFQSGSALQRRSCGHGPRRPADRSAAAAAFLAQACAPLAISTWNVTELHSALGLKVRTKALSKAQVEAILQGFESCLDAPFVAAAQQLGLEAQLLGAGGKPVSN